jgi:MFS family permease
VRRRGAPDESGVTAPDRARGMLRFLAAHRDFRQLWLARAVSFLGDSVGLVALILYVAQSHRSAVAVALLMLAVDLVPHVFSPISGTLADRIDGRVVMVGCELAQAAIVAVVALTLPALPVLLPLVALRASIAALFQPASRAVVPSLVEPGELGPANAAIGLGTHGFDVLGPLLAAALLPWLSFSGLLLLDAASFAVSALLLLRLPRTDRITSPAEAGSFSAGVREGLGFLLHARFVRLVALGFVLVVAFNGVDDVALVYLGRTSLQLSPALTSLLYAGVGAGLFVGFGLVGRYGHRIPVTTLLVLGYLISSLGNALTGLAWAVGAAFATQAVRGIGLGAMDTANDTLIQTNVPPALLGRAFSNIYGAVAVAGGLSYLLGSLLIDLAGPRVTFLVAGSGGILVGLAVASRMGAAGRAAAQSPGGSARAP